MTGRKSSAHSPSPAAIVPAAVPAMSTTGHGRTYDATVRRPRIPRVATAAHLSTPRSMTPSIPISVVPPTHPTPAHRPLLAPTTSASLIAISPTNVYCDLLPTSPHRVLYHDMLYPSAQHLFEAFKFMETYPELLPRLQSCNFDELRSLVGRYLHRAMEGWEDKRAEHMEQALSTKLIQHAWLQSQLLETGDGEILYVVRDYVWGFWPDGSGQNLLGEAMMMVRARLTSLPRTPPPMKSASRPLPTHGISPLPVLESPSIPFWNHDSTYVSLPTFLTTNDSFDCFSLHPLVGEGLLLFGEVLSMVPLSHETDDSVHSQLRSSGGFFIDSTSIFEVTGQPGTDTASGLHIVSRGDDGSTEVCRLYGQEVRIKCLDKDDFSDTQIKNLLPRVSDIEESANRTYWKTIPLPS